MRRCGAQRKGTAQGSGWWKEEISFVELIPELFSSRSLLSLSEYTRSFDNLRDRIAQTTEFSGSNWAIAKLLIGKRFLENQGDSRRYGIEPYRSECWEENPGTSLKLSGAFCH